MPAAAAGGSAYDTLILAETGLTHFWPLSETSGTTAFDKVASGAVNGTSGNFPTINQTSTMPTCTDPCYLFSSNAQINLTGFLIDSSGDWSIEWWGNLTSTAFTTNFGWPVFIGNVSTAGWGVQCDSTTLDINQTANSRVVGPTGAKATNAHVVITRSGSSLIFYINNVSTSKTIGTMDHPASGATQIGCEVPGGGGSGFLAGSKLQKMAFYNVALSSVRVAAHFAAG